MILKPKESHNQTLREEFANSISHGAGFIAALIAAPFLIHFSTTSGDAWIIAGISVFISTVIVLYLSSTIYHSMKESRLKEYFQVVDHSAIFLLIAGTYTPFTLGAMRGGWGWTLFGIVWGIALAGILMKVFVGVQSPKISTMLYLLMGWMILFAIKPFMETVPLPGLLWIAAGGLAYTVGVVFYALPRLRYSHFIWHLFVLAGTGCHFVAVAMYSF